MKDIKGTTKLCALLGNPTEHSLSPLIHNNLAYLSSTDMAYTTFCVEKDKLGDAVKGAFALGIAGMNVTVPYKQDVMEFLAGTDPVAKAIGAVNTLVRTETGFYGYNTDILGFLRELSENEFDVKGRDVVILGAGGVARAICFACAGEGAGRIFILNRSIDRARAIANDAEEYFGFEKGKRIFPKGMSESENIDASGFLLVQTTNVGMYPNNDDIIIEESRLYHEAAFGFDVVYNPYETKFIKKLKSYNVKAVNGLPMLLYQGVEAYKMWFDAKISREMERGVFNKLRAEFREDHNENRRQIASKENIILVGFMGSGKTTLGKWISKRTGRKLLDTDKEIERISGKTIPEIFEQGGEAAFRKMETDYLKKLAETKQSNIVLSVGGGTPINPENRAILKKIGTVVYLRASSEELMRRLQYDTRRPLLAGKNGDERRELIEKMIHEREPAYFDSANMVVTTDGVYFPRIYQIINRKMHAVRYGTSRRKNKNFKTESSGNQKKTKFVKPANSKSNRKVKNSQKTTLSVKKKEGIRNENSGN